MKICFASQFFLFRAFNVDDKSYRQVLTPVNNSHVLLKLEITRQVQTCYKPHNTTQNKLQHFLVYTSTGEMGILMTLKHSVDITMLAACVCTVIFTFDAAQALAFLSQLSQTMPLSYNNI